MIRCSERSYYNEYFAKNNKKIKKLWVGINQIVNNVKNKDQGPTCIEIDNDGTTVTVTKPTEIAEEFNKHYSNVADKILNKRKYQDKHHFRKYLNNPNSKTCMSNNPKTCMSNNPTPTTYIPNIDNPKPHPKYSGQCISLQVSDQEYNLAPWG